MDDNFEFRVMITRQLERLGCQVKATANASEFLGELYSAQRPFDLAVIDVRLPGLNGDEIVSWMHESEDEAHRAMPIFFVTGFPNQALQEIATQNSKVKVLKKPLSYQDLKEEILSIGPRQRVH
ncbi:MAG: response regulator [Roseobacter sp.]